MRLHDIDRMRRSKRKYQRQPTLIAEKGGMYRLFDNQDSTYSLWIFDPQGGRMCEPMSMAEVLHEICVYSQSDWFRI